MELVVDRRDSCVSCGQPIVENDTVVILQRGEVRHDWENGGNLVVANVETVLAHAKCQVLK